MKKNVLSNTGSSSVHFDNAITSLNQSLIHTYSTISNAAKIGKNSVLGATIGFSGLAVMGSMPSLGSFQILENFLIPGRILLENISNHTNDLRNSIDISILEPQEELAGIGIRSLLYPTIIIGALIGTIYDIQLIDNCLKEGAKATTNATYAVKEGIVGSVIWMIEATCVNSLYNGDASIIGENIQDEVELIGSSLNSDI